MSLSPSLSQIFGIVALAGLVFVAFRFRHQIKKFILEALSELKKVSWTTRKDLIDSTTVVLVSSAFLGLYIGVIDYLLSKIVASLIK